MFHTAAVMFHATPLLCFAAPLRCSVPFHCAAGLCLATLPCYPCHLLFHCCCLLLGRSLCFFGYVGQIVTLSLVEWLSVTGLLAGLIGIWFGWLRHHSARLVVSCGHLVACSAQSLLLCRLIVECQMVVGRSIARWVDSSLIGWAARPADHRRAC